MRSARFCLVSLALLPLLGTGCGFLVSSTTERCDDDTGCAAGARCELGQCVPVGADDAGGRPLLDGGGDHDAGPTPADAGPRRDGGGDMDRDAGGVPVDAGGDEELDGGDGRFDGGVPDAGEVEVCPAVCPDRLHRGPIEVCDDGWDNDCDGQIDEAPCGAMRTLVIAAADALPAGYSVAVSIADLPIADDNGAVDLTGSAVRVWRYEPGTEDFVEVPRVLDPGESWADPRTLWFPLAGGIAAGAVNAGGYRLTWDALPDADPASAPYAEEAAVFHFADFFEEPMTAGAPPWTFVENPGNDFDINVRDGALWIDSVDNDSNGFPYASADFADLQGRFVVDLGFTWTGEDSDDDYAWRLLVGSATMEPPATNQDIDETGVGPNVIWGYGDSEFGLPARLSLAVDKQPNDPLIIDTNVEGRQRLLLHGDTTTGTFDAELVDGGARANFSFVDTTTTSLAKLHIYPSELHHTANDARFGDRRFEHVIVRRAVANGPTVTLRSETPCE